jgi:hypothetical protein
VSIGTHSVIRATCYLLALSVSPSASLAQQLDLDALYAQAAAEGVRPFRTGLHDGHFHHRTLLVVGPHR